MLEEKLPYECVTVYIFNDQSNKLDIYQDLVIDRSHVLEYDRYYVLDEDAEICIEVPTEAGMVLQTDHLYTVWLRTKDDPLAIYLFTKYLSDKMRGYFDIIEKLIQQIK